MLTSVKLLLCSFSAYNYSLLFLLLFFLSQTRQKSDTHTLIFSLSLSLFSFLYLVGDINKNFIRNSRLNLSTYFETHWCMTKKSSILSHNFIHIQNIWFNKRSCSTIIDEPLNYIIWSNEYRNELIWVVKLIDSIV